MCVYALHSLARLQYVASCALNWEQYHANPDQLNFFKYIQMESGCGNHNGVTCITDPPKNPRAILCTDPKQYRLPRDNASIVVERVSDYHVEADGTLDPALFIFHEGRVGSTLTANMFAASRENLVRVPDSDSTFFSVGDVEPWLVLTDSLVTAFDSLTRCTWRTRFRRR